MIWASYQRWTRHQDVGWMSSSATLRVWAAHTVVAAVVIGGVQLPVVRDYVGLDPLAASLFFGVALLLGVIASLLQKHPSHQVRAGAILADQLGTVFCLCGWAAWSRHTIGAAIFVGILAMAIVYMGVMVRCTLREPFYAIGVVLAVAGVALFGPYGHSSVLLLVVGLVSAYTAAMGGSWQVDADRRREQSDQMRLAIDASVLADQHARIHHLERSLLDAYGVRHDLNNLIQSLSVNVELLELLIERGRNEDIPRVLTKILRSTQALGNITERRLRGEPGEAAEETVVSVRESLERVLELVQPRFPNTRLLHEGRDHHVVVAGGPLNLDRMLVNLVTNACEGDGDHAAETVTISTMANSTGKLVAVTVSDDGPGIPEEILQSRAPWATTKREGTGLGLFTTRRLCDASGATLALENDELSGARVTITLMRADSG